MSEGFGLGDGPRDMSNMSSVADAQTEDARRRATHHPPGGRWPSASTVVRVVAVAIVAIVVVGWIVTALARTA